MATSTAPAGRPSSPPALEVRALRKSYGAAPVLRGVDLQIVSGEVHALLGANGAGKSTLIGCLNGATTPSGGTVLVDGRPLRPTTPAAARAAGVVTIHQHLSLVGELTVTENLFLGEELTRRGLVRRRTQQRMATEVLDRFGLRVPPTARVGDLPVGLRQLVEIAKAWRAGHIRVLVLDEPTASLSQPEADALLAEVERMRLSGVAIVYVTHRLDEVFRVADSVTVLRDGLVALRSDVDGLAPADLVEAIAPTAASPAATVAPRRPTTASGDKALLRVDGVTGLRVGPVSFEVAAGQVVGIFGAIGSGRSSLLETLAGHHRMTAGTVQVAGSAATLRNPRRARAEGVGFVPADRATQALWPGLSASDNLTAPSMTHLGVAGLRRRSEERRLFDEVAGRLDLRPPDPSRAVRHFSGGNQQKLVVGRLSARPVPRVLLLDEPTQGVDVGARREIYREVRRLAREEGCAVVFASSEPTEVLELADDVLVMVDGRIALRARAGETDTAALLGAAHHLLTDGAAR